MRDQDVVERSQKPAHKEERGHDRHGPLVAVIHWGRLPAVYVRVKSHVFWKLSFVNKPSVRLRESHENGDLIGAIQRTHCQLDARPENLLRRNGRPLMSTLVLADLH